MPPQPDRQGKREVTTGTEVNPLNYLAPHPLTRKPTYTDLLKLLYFPPLHIRIYLYILVFSHEYIYPVNFDPINNPYLSAQYAH